MRRRLSIRASVALWAAMFAIAIGAIGVIASITITSGRLRDSAREPGGPAAAVPPRMNNPGPLAFPVRPLPLPRGPQAEGRVVERVLKTSRRDGIVIVLVLSVGSLALSWFAAARILRPVRQISQAVRRVSSPGSGHRISYDGPGDELGELADTVDAMLDRLDESFQAQSRFVANASHELKTPLAILRTEIDTSLEAGNLTTADLRVSLGRIRQEVVRTTDLVNALLDLGRAETIRQREHVDLADSAEAAIGMVCHLRVGTPTLSIDSQLASAPTSGDAILLDRMVYNVVENAFRYCREYGTVIIRTKSDENAAIVIVENDGVELDSRSIPELFGRFTRGSGRSRVDGHGLGLAIVKTVVETHGGTINAGPGARGGLRLEIRIPR